MNQENAKLVLAAFVTLMRQEKDLKASEGALIRIICELGAFIPLNVALALLNKYPKYKEEILRDSLIELEDSDPGLAAILDWNDDF
jgi:hypothetical protein